MGRIAVAVCCVICLGCVRAQESENVAGESEFGVDGGTVKNANRDKANEFFQLLGEVQTVDEEEGLATEFAAWLNENGYKVVVEEDNGKHILSCPYFPPVTPWTSHTFLAAENLELLPQ